METKQKQIKEFYALNITYWDAKEIDALYQKEEWFKTIAFSKGKHGLNAVVFQGGITKQLYKITCKCTNLSRINLD